MNFFLENLKAKLALEKLTQKELAEKTNISINTIRGWFSKNLTPDIEQASKIASALNTTVDFFISGKGSGGKDSYIPLLNQTVSAGFGDALPEDDGVKMWLPCPSHIVRRFGKENLKGLVVHGDSMEPTLYDGDVVFCDSLGYDGGEGVYVVQLNGLGYIKRLQIAVGKVLIKSDNPKYETIEEPIESQSIRIIGKMRFILTSVF